MFSALKALGVSSADEADFFEEETKEEVETHEIELDGSTVEFRAALGSDPLEAAESEGKITTGKTFGARFATPIGAQLPEDGFSLKICSIFTVENENNNLLYILIYKGDRVSCTSRISLRLISTVIFQMIFAGAPSPFDLSQICLLSPPSLSPSNQNQ